MNVVACHLGENGWFLMKKEIDQPNGVFSGIIKTFLFVPRCPQMRVKLNIFQ